MVRKNIVVIRVVTLEDQTLLRMHGDLIEAYYPALRTDSYCIGEQPRGVCDLKTKTLAVPKIIALAKKHQDADAIVISCCDDPAVEELREMLSVPVIGAGTAVSAVARGLGKRVGIIGITEYVPEPYRRILGDDRRGPGERAAQGEGVESPGRELYCSGMYGNEHDSDCPGD